MKEFQSRFIQCLERIKEGIRLKPKPVDLTVEKQDSQKVIESAGSASFDVRTVAGRYEITKKPDDFPG